LGEEFCLTHSVIILGINYTTDIIGIISPGASLVLEVDSCTFNGNKAFGGAINFNIGAGAYGRSTVTRSTFSNNVFAGTS